MTLLSPNALNEIEARHSEQWKHSKSENEQYNWVSEPFAARVYCDRAALLDHIKSLQPQSTPDEAGMREILAEELEKRWGSDSPSVKYIRLGQFNNVCADPIVFCEVAIAAMRRVSSPPQVDRDTIIEECAKVADGFRRELELAEIAKAPTGGVLYNPEQTLWKKAATAIRALKGK